MYKINYLINKKIISNNIFNKKMENEKLSFSNSLWGRYEQLNERIQIKKQYFKSIDKIFQNIDESLKSTLKKTKESKIEENPPSDEEKDFHEIIKTFKQYIIDSLDYDSQTILNISNNIKSLLEKIRDEKKTYKDLKTSLNDYENCKNNMNKLMKSYHTKSETAENLVVKFKTSQIENSGNEAPEVIQSLKELEKNTKNNCEDALNFYNKYKTSVAKVNEAREKFNEIQKEILYNFQEIEFFKGKLNSNLIGIIIQNQKNQIDINQTKITKFESIKSNLNINRDIKNMLMEFKSKEKPDEEIFLINFTSNIDFNKCEDEKSFNFNVDCINYIQNINKEEYPKYNIEVEKMKNKMRNLLAKMFDNSENISANDKKELLNYISNPETHFLFLILLSKSRTNNRFCQSKNLINILGEALNKILEDAKKNENYSYARICVVLSQTFYYNDEKNDKIFILEKIKNNSWMRSNEFWINYTEIAIKEEFEKIIFKNFPEISMDDIINESEKINDRAKRKISEILFSQLLPCVNNMKEFNIDNKTMVNVIDDILYKYNYLSEDNIDVAFGFISENKENIQKIRNENAKNHKPKIKIEETKTTEVQDKSFTKSLKSKFNNIGSFFNFYKGNEENDKGKNTPETKDNNKVEKKEEKKETKEVKKEETKINEPKKTVKFEKTEKTEKKINEVKKSETLNDKNDNKVSSFNKIHQEMKNNVNTKTENKIASNNTFAKNNLNTNNNLNNNKPTINKFSSGTINYNNNLPVKNVTNDNISNVKLNKTKTVGPITQPNNEPKKDDKYSVFNVKLRKVPNQK